MPSNVKQPSSRKTYMDDNKIDNSDTNNIKMKHCNTKTEIYNRKQNKGVKIGHLNIRSLLKKIDEIKILIHQNSFDILAISETTRLNQATHIALSLVAVTSIFPRLAV